MMLTDDISVDDLLWKVQNIGDQLKDYTEKLVFSYADITMYKKVKHNLEVSGISYNEWNIEQMEEFADKLSIMNRERSWNFQLTTCGKKNRYFKIWHSTQSLHRRRSDYSFGME